MFLQTTLTATKSRNFFLDILKRSTCISHLTQIHAQIILNGLKDDISTVTKLTHRLSDLNAMCYAQDLVLSVPKPDIFLLNVLIRGFSNNQSPLSSIRLFTGLKKHTGLKPDKFTYAFAVSAASGTGDEKFADLLLGQAIVDGYGSDLFVGSAFVDFYFKVWRVGYAKKVFDKMPERDTVLWNTMVSGFVRNNLFEDAIRVFGELIQSGDSRLDLTTVAAALPAVSELQELKLGLEIQCLAMKLGFHSHTHILTGLISLYSKCGDVQTSSRLFEEIDNPDIVSCNAMIAGYTCNGEIELSLSLFKKLFSSGQKVNLSTVVGLIPVSSPVGQSTFTSCIHGFCEKSGFVSRTSLSTALVTVYCRLNETESARKLFDEALDKSLPSWNAMISGYTQNGMTDMAISLFQQMQKSEVAPNPVTITCILSACAQLGALSLGKWVHSLVRSNGFESNIYVSTTLIDMYAKCGSLAEARQLFDSMPEKNAVTWNAMISSYGLHGHGNKALEVFAEMSNSEVIPSKVTFLSVLYACSHAGLVREGDEIFRSMVRDYGIDPLPEHYACMIDVYGRAGQLEKALEFIKGMPVEPGAAEWGALLGACMIHKDTNLARLASEKLFEIDPENTGYYVLLSNIFSAERNYPQAALVRQAVKRRNLAKTPGCTLIEIGDTMHIFTSGDKSHPQSDAIYAELESLEGKMKEAGFQPETAMAWHDVEEEEKEMMVKVHSEKLAIAFGLLVTEEGSEIRIIKNLRVCLDCHTATKFISKITKRTIVVRDASRFHHFKDGVCSCGDYW